MNEVPAQVKPKADQPKNQQCRKKCLQHSHIPSNVSALAA